MSKFMLHKIYKYKNLKFICGCKILPPQGYSAITLFGYVLTKRTKERVQEYLSTKLGQRWANHEYIHILQKESLHSWILFYILYLWYFFSAFPLIFMDWNQAYHSIPFEIEAYKNVEDFTYSKSEWKKYKLSLNQRKNLDYKNIKNHVNEA